MELVACDSVFRLLKIGNQRVGKLYFFRMNKPNKTVEIKHREITPPIKSRTKQISH